MPHIEKNFFYIEYVLTYFMHLFNFICLEKLGKFFCRKWLGLVVAWFSCC